MLTLVAMSFLYLIECGFYVMKAGQISQKLKFKESIKCFKEKENLIELPSEFWAVFLSHIFDYSN